MDSAVLLHSLYQDLRNHPLRTVRTVWRYLREDPVIVLVRTVEALPDATASALLRPLVDGWASVHRPAALRWLRVLALLRLGYQHEALAAAKAGQRGGRELAATARLLLDAEQPSAALALSRDARPTRPNGARVEALSLARLGRLGEAQRIAERAAERWPSNTAVAKVRRRITGQRRILDPDWAPSVATVANRTAPISGRILHLLNNSVPHLTAGYTIRSHQMAIAQVNAGLDPHMVTRVDFPTTKGVLAVPAIEDVDGIPYHRLLPGGSRGLPPDEVVALQTRLCDKLVRRLRPAAIHGTTPSFNAQVGQALATAHQLPFVYEVRGFLEETWASRFAEGHSTELYGASRAVETECMRRAHHVVTLGEAMQTEIISRGIDPERVSVIGNAVDPARFDPAKADPSARAALGFRPDEVVLGYISSLVGYEGIDTLLEAVARLRESSTRFRLLVVGEGPERLRLQKRATELALHETAVFPGRVHHEAIVDLYGAIDLFVVPRRDVRVCRLVTPLKPIEAMALQRPLLVSDLPALTELLDSGANGRAFAADSADALAEQACTLGEDPGTRAALGANGRRWVLKHRTWSRNGECYRSLYASLGAA